MKTIHAVYERGVFRPLETVELPERAEVRLTIEPLVNGKTVEERLAALDELMKIAKPHPGPHLTRDELHERR